MVKPTFLFLSNHAIAVPTVELVHHRIHQRGRVTQLVNSQVFEDLKQRLWCDAVVSMLIHTEILFYRRESLNEQPSKGLTQSLLDLLASEQCPEILSIDKQQILSGGVVNIEYLDDGSEARSELVATDATWRKHGDDYLNLVVELDEL